MSYTPKTGAAVGSPWFVHYGPEGRESLRLFCFPYAGGGPLIFREWADWLPPRVGVCAVHLPGRGGRLAEPPLTHLEPLVRALAEAILPSLSLPFAFFGHSMGSILCFELARSLRREHGLEPSHLFVAGRRAPQLAEQPPPIHDLPEGELLEELRRLDGTPDEVLEHPELMRMMLPILRADFSVTHNYRYHPGPPLNCPIYAFGGLHDPETSYEKLDAWREQTAAEFVLRMIPGNHFFLNTARPLLLRIISRELLSSMPAAR